MLGGLNNPARLMRRDRVPRLSARRWIVRLNSNEVLTARMNAGAKLRFIANAGCADRMQRHVAALVKNVTL